MTAPTPDDRARLVASTLRSFAGALSGIGDLVGPVIDQLGELADLVDPPDVRRCRECGCTDEDCSQCVARTGQPCGWVYADLCSACASSAVTIGGGLPPYEPRPGDVALVTYDFSGEPETTRALLGVRGVWKTALGEIDAVNVTEVQLLKVAPA